MQRRAVGSCGQLIGIADWAEPRSGAVLLIYSMYILRDQKRTQNLIYSTAFLLMGILLVTLVLLAFSGTGILIDVVRAYS